MPERTYTYYPNTIVDTLNEIHKNLNETDVSHSTTLKDALNDISEDLGGGRHLQTPDAIRDVGQNMRKELNEFSTAKVTIMNDWISNGNIMIPHLKSIEENTILATAYTLPSTNNDCEIEVVLYNGEFDFLTSSYDRMSVDLQSVTGDVEMDGGMVIITGDCSFRIINSGSALL